MIIQYWLIHQLMVSSLGQLLRLRGEAGASHEPLGQNRVERKVERQVLQLIIHHTHTVYLQDEVYPARLRVSTKKKTSNCWILLLTYFPLELRSDMWQKVSPEDQEKCSDRDDGEFWWVDFVKVVNKQQSRDVYSRLRGILLIYNSQREGGGCGSEADKCDGFTSSPINTCKTSLCNNLECTLVTYVQ